MTTHLQPAHTELRFRTILVDGPGSFFDFQVCENSDFFFKVGTGKPVMSRVK